eukprot:COSAG02_NODE_385_length_23394_cov_43.838807_20_plen_89_part_00
MGSRAAEFRAAGSALWGGGGGAGCAAAADLRKQRTHDDDILGAGATMSKPAFAEALSRDDSDADYDNSSREKGGSGPARSIPFPTSTL